MIDYKNVAVKEPLTLKEAINNTLDGLMFVFLIGSTIFLWFLVEAQVA